MVPEHTALNTAVASSLGAGLHGRIPNTKQDSQAHYRELRDLPTKKKDSHEDIQWTTDTSDGSDKVSKTYTQILHSHKAQMPYSGLCGVAASMPLQSLKPLLSLKHLSIFFGKEQD